jgi:prepilin-type processing-associated H-X9-DG protein
VQAARARAARAYCASRLRQLGVALAAYEAQERVFPDSADAGYEGPGKLYGIRRFSGFCALLPHLEADETYDLINFSRPYFVMGNVVSDGAYPIAAHQTAARRRVGVLLCPADPEPRRVEFGPVSYRANRGTTWYFSGTGSRSDNGAFRAGVFLRAADFADGLSKTAMLSEKPWGAGGPNFRPFVGFWDTGLLATSVDELLAICRLPRPANARFQNRVGHVWLQPGYRFTDYNHNETPNAATPDCIQYGQGTDHPLDGAFTARSFHPGGVNVLFGDGRVDFVGSGIDRAAWRAFGTRAGGENVAKQL